MSKVIETVSEVLELLADVNMNATAKSVRNSYQKKLNQAYDLLFNLKKDLYWEEKQNGFR